MFMQSLVGDCCDLFHSIQYSNILINILFNIQRNNLFHIQYKKTINKLIQKQDKKQRRKTVINR